MWDDMWDEASETRGVKVKKVVQPQPDPILCKLYEIVDGLTLRPVHRGAHDSPRIFRDFLRSQKGERPMVIVMGSPEVIERLAGTNVALPVNSDGSFAENG